MFFSFFQLLVFFLYKGRNLKSFFSKKKKIFVFKKLKKKNENKIKEKIIWDKFLYEFLLLFDYFRNVLWFFPPSPSPWLILTADGNKKMHKKSTENKLLLQYENLDGDIRLLCVPLFHAPHELRKNAIIYNKKTTQNGSLFRVLMNLFIGKDSQPLSFFIPKTKNKQTCSLRRSFQFHETE